MNMSKEAYQNIMVAAEKMEKADEAMTAAIAALESHDYPEVKKQVAIVLAVSDGLEQRIAAQYMRQLADKEDLAESIAVLKVACDYNKRVQKQFCQTCEDFKQTMIRIQTKM